MTTKDSAMTIPLSASKCYDIMQTVENGIQTWERLDPEPKRFSLRWRKPKGKIREINTSVVMMPVNDAETYIHISTYMGGLGDVGYTEKEHMKLVGAFEVQIRKATEVTSFAQQRSSQPRPNVGSVGGVAEQLERLSDLKEHGAITDKEFQAAKRKLLGL